MDNKELKIVPPSGYEIDREQSTLDCIKFKPIEKKKLTYNDVAKELFIGFTYWYTNYEGKICSAPGRGHRALDLNNCTSEKQAKKLLAINRLMNVAKYLNKGWKPDWNNVHEEKYYLKIVDNDLKEINVGVVCTVKSGDIYFKSEELARQAVEILGEDTVRLALSTDW